MNYLIQKTSNKVFFLALLSVSLFAFRANAQQKKADNTILYSEKNNKDNTYKLISFAPNIEWKESNNKEIFKKYLGINGVENKMLFSNSTTTKQKITTSRYNQFYKGIKIDFASFTLNSKNGIVNFISGNYYMPDNTLSTTPVLTESAAFNTAINYIGAEKYMWQDAACEAKLKSIFHKPDTTYLPKGQLVWVEDFLNGNGSRKLHLAYSFDIYAQKPISREVVYIDAINGTVLLSNSMIKHTATTGHSLYSANVPIQTAHVGATFILFDSTRGSGVYTQNAHNGTSLGAATNFSSAGDTWPSSTADSQAVDAHWGGEIVYDYWNTQQGRLSWDNLNGILLSYVHWDAGLDNAFWDGTEMCYGDGTGISAGGFRPLTSLDVTAHEIGHGVCQATCNLVYAGESGGLNEGLSDCWGATIENWGNPHEVDAMPKKPWYIGEEIGGPIRRLDSPKLFSLPDTYLGTYWYTTTSCTPSGGNDQCGVHTNMGVLSKWYYLVVSGGTGTNDIGSTYAVTGIGWTEAATILYQTELAMPSTCDYPTARTVSIAAATTLYGACSPEVQTVTNAWYAVGVGTSFVPCNPQIGFVTTVLNVTENAATTSCPASRVINIGLHTLVAPTGGSPVVTVTAASGTAVAGVDYTLGSTSLTFPAGSTATQYATLTIYDNGAVHDSKNLVLTFSLAAMGSDATVDLANDSMHINIFNDDSVPTVGYTIYPTLNTGTAVTSNLTSSFYASRRRAHSQFLLYASEMTAAGVLPGVPISQIAFNVTTKNSTIPFVGYTVKMGNTTATDLTTGYATPVTTVYTGSPSSNTGWDSLDFNITNFTWDGTSNVAVEICFGQNSGSATANDQVMGIQQASAIVANYNSTNTGAGTGCTLGFSMPNQSTARPVMRFKQAVPPTPIETVMGSNRTWDVHTGQENYFYNPTDSFLIAGLKNETNNLGCVTARITQQGTGFVPEVFSGGNRSLKEFSFTPSINPTTTNYDATFYMTITELNGVTPSTLYILKTEAHNDASITTANAVTVTPVITIGSTYVAFKGTFSGFSATDSSRYFLVDATLCTALVAPTPLSIPSSPCTGSTTTYSVNTVTGATSYIWTVTGIGWSGTSTTNAINLTVGTGVATITATASNSCGSGTPYSFTVTPSVLPSTPVVTLPGTTPCAGSSVSTYNASSAGSTGFSWSVSGMGWSGSSAIGSFVPNVGSGVGTIIVSGINACGNSTNDTVIVTPLPLPGLPAITMPTLPCSGATSAIYTASSASATSYSWTVSGGGWSGASTTGALTATVGAGAGTIVCTGVNSCGSGTAYTFTVTPSPMPPAPTVSLSGSIPCVGASSATYTASSTGAMSYSWTVLGTGWSGTSSTGTLTVTIGSGTGTIICSGINSCGAGTADTTYLTPSSGVGAASMIIEPTSICEGSTATFTTPAITGATSYAWVVLGTGWSGTSTTNSITLTVGTGIASITVYGLSACGGGSSFTLATVFPVVPPTANFSIAHHLISLGSTDSIIYSGTASGSGSYVWNFAGGVATPGTGGGTHRVTWATTGLKTISLTVTDSGCTSTVFTDTVLVTTTTEILPVISNLEAMILPNPNDGNFDIVFNKEIEKNISIKLMDMQGRLVYAHEFSGTSNNKLSINTANLANAVYLATILTDNCISYKKIIINR